MAPASLGEAAAIMGGGMDERQPPIKKYYDDQAGWEGSDWGVGEAGGLRLQRLAACRRASILR